MNEYLSDFVAGEIGSPGLVDSLGTLLASGQLTPAEFWRPAMSRVHELFIWFLSSLPSLSLWIRQTPFVMTLASIFFVGCLVAIFLRLYHSIL